MEKTKVKKESNILAGYNKTSSSNVAENLLKSFGLSDEVSKEQIEVDAEEIEIKPIASENIIKTEAEEGKPIKEKVQKPKQKKETTQTKNYFNDHPENINDVISMLSINDRTCDISRQVNVKMDNEIYAIIQQLSFYLNYSKETKSITNRHIVENIIIDFKIKNSELFSHIKKTILNNI